MGHRDSECRYPDYFGFTFGRCFAWPLPLATFFILLGFVVTLSDLSDFLSIGACVFFVARNPYIEMFLRHALSGLSGFILAEILTVVATGYLLRFICQRMSSPSDTLAIPTVRQCCYISLAGNIVAFVTSMFLSFIYQDYVHGHH